MARCPVCQTRYSGGNTRYCPVCGWDVESYSLMIGLIPEVAEKEKNRLQWAKSLWLKLKPQQDHIRQLQMQLKEYDEQVRQLQMQLEQAQQEQNRLDAALQAQNATRTREQEQLQQAQQEILYWRGRLDQSNQDREQLAQMLQAQEAAIAQLQARVNDLISAATAAPPLAGADNSDIVPVSAAAVSAAMPREPESFEVNRSELKPSELKPPASPAAPLNTASVLLSFRVVTVDRYGQPQSTVEKQAYGIQERINGAVLTLIQIPDGQFWMGSPATEAGRETHEDPRHLVTVPSFAISQGPITQAFWQAVAQLEPIERLLNPDPSQFKGADCPVERVSWLDAVEFCARLTRATNRIYRLPSEAEWEYAARGGTSTPFHFGDTLTAELANYDANDIYGEGPEGLYRQHTTPIGSFQVANAFGLYDIHGNVWEWCADPWHDDYDQAPSDGSIWTAENSDNRRVLRGGSWYCLPSLCRSAQRHWEQMDHSGSGISFRVVCTDVF
ncbi:MAG: SUMF1/EgtB/PvdO family nonheme iron enzyme [Synechococcales cyanobacterium M58_A2018_015]|nr:SUMF1/EgtB/PvdO family nonheme iron enzyme [Synechococcales cyanobacterium M58_A2018_015]